MPLKLGKNEGAQRFVSDVRGDAARFAESNLADADVGLDFEEFLAMQPEQILKARPMEEIRGWFDQAAGLDQRLSITEFFHFSLSKASENAGATALRDCFRRWDTDRSGYLDAVEFAIAVQEMGYGAVAHTLFKSLDADNSGAVTYDELAAKLLKSADSTPGAKGLVSSLVWSSSKSIAKSSSRATDAGIGKGGGARASETAAQVAVAIDTSKWVIRGRDVPTVREELQQLLRNSGAHVIDVVKLFDRDVGSELSIDGVEFYDAIRTHFGYKGSKWVIDAVFQSLDSDDSGEIGYDELFEFVKGRRHQLDERNKKVRNLRIEAPQRPWAAIPLQLEDIVWDVETLRILMQQMIARCKVGPHDLLTEWASKKSTDQSDLQLTRREYMLSMQAFFMPQHECLWNEVVEPVVQSSFHEIVALWKGASGSHLTAHVDLVRFERWLNPPTERASHLEVVRLNRTQTLRRQKALTLRSQGLPSSSSSRSGQAPAHAPAADEKRKSGASRSRRPSSPQPVVDAAASALPPSWATSSAKLSAMRNVGRDVWREEDRRRTLRLNAFLTESNNNNTIIPGPTAKLGLGVANTSAADSDYSSISLLSSHQQHVHTSSSPQGNSILASSLLSPRDASSLLSPRDASSLLSPRDAMLPLPSPHPPLLATRPTARSSSTVTRTATSTAHTTGYPTGLTTGLTTGQQRRRRRGQDHVVPSQPASAPRASTADQQLASISTGPTIPIIANHRPATPPEPITAAWLSAHQQEPSRAVTAPGSARGGAQTQEGAMEGGPAPAATAALVTPSCTQSHASSISPRCQEHGQQPTSSKPALGPAHHLDDERLGTSGQNMAHHSSRRARRPSCRTAYSARLPSQAARLGASLAADSLLLSQRWEAEWGRKPPERWPLLPRSAPPAAPALAGAVLGEAVTLTPPAGFTAVTAALTKAEAGLLHQRHKEAAWLGDRLPLPFTRRPG